MLAKRAKAIERSLSASTTVGPCFEFNSLLSNARCLGEGVDVRAIDCVGFIDPRKSNIDIVQAVGRAIRKSDESKIGTIVLPVLIDSFADNEVDERLNSSRFSPIWAVIIALRAHDEVLPEQIDQLRFQMGRRWLLSRCRRSTACTRSPNPPPPSCFSALKSVPLSMNAYSRKSSRENRHRDRKNVGKHHIQEGSPKVDEHSSNDSLDETSKNRCFSLDLWRTAIRQWS